jgi:polysaccharide biosynthesis transport protein
MAIISGNRASRSPTAGRQIDSSIDLLGLTETLLRRRWTIIVCVLAFVALAFVALSLIAPRYVATSRIFIDPREQRAVQNEVIQRGLGGDMALVESQIEVVKSEAVLGDAIKQIGLASDPEFVPQGDGGRNPSEVALENLAKAVEVVRPDNTYVLEISVTAKEAAKSARLANAVAAAYVADQTSSAANAARDVTSAIRSRLAELQSQLHESEEKVEAFKREHNISQTEGQLLGDRELTNLSARQSAALSRVNEAKARLQVMQDALSARGYVGAATTDTDSSMGALRVRLAEAKGRLNELEQVLGPRHPRVVVAKGEVAQAEDAIRAESERLVATAQDDYKTAVDALNKVNTDLQQATSASFSTNQNMIKLRELEREAQSIRVVYESYLVRAKETAQQESIAAGTARVIAEAGVPNSPSFPPRVPIIAAAVMLGLFVGILIAILRDLVAGLLTRQQEAELPMRPEAGADTPAGGLVLVTTLDDPSMARQAALELAHGAMARDRSVIFLDLAADAPASMPGLAEIALGEASAINAVETCSDTELHKLNAGRPAAIARVSHDVLRAVLEVISAEYDDVVINAGELDVEHGTPVRVAAEMSDHAVLAVKGDRAGPREKWVLDALSNEGAVSVSFASVGTAADLDKVA